VFPCRQFHQRKSIETLSFPPALFGITNQFGKFSVSSNNHTIVGNNNGAYQEAELIHHSISPLLHKKVTEESLKEIRL